MTSPEAARGPGTPASERGEESVEDHLARILDDITPLAPIELGLNEALGHVAADDVTATEPLPPYPIALVRGYAATATDLATASATSPKLLRILPEGEPWQPGCAAVAHPGLPLPEGADTVLAEETVGRQDDMLRTVTPAPAGLNVRTVGSDIRPGQHVLRAGRRIRPGDVAVLAAVGHARVRCHPQPRVVVLPTGSELVGIDAPVRRGLIRNSNGPMLQALLRQSDALTFTSEAVADDRRSLIEAFESNLGHADAFVTVGGTRGAVLDVLRMIGEVQPTTVAMEPGRSQLYGRVRGIPVFGLPGHPAATFVAFELFVRPALRRLQGRRDLLRPRIEARLAEDIVSTPGPTSYLRVRLRRGARGWEASLAGSQDPHDLRSLGLADGLAEIPAGVEVAHAGRKVRVHLLVEP